MLLYTLLRLLFTDPTQFVLIIVLLIFPLLISVTLHEIAHGFVAYKFGDPTPKIQGRLTLNPFAHLDPVGTLMLFIIGIGWAKPVIINPLNIQGKTKQMLVALAGPMTNFLLALIFSIALVIIAHINAPEYTSLLSFSKIPLTLIVRINLILAVFNMMPIPPLDGSRVLSWMLPDKLADLYSRLEPYGMFILLLLLFTVGFKSIFNIAITLQNLLYTQLDLLYNNIIGGTFFNRP